MTAARWILPLVVLGGAAHDASAQQCTLEGSGVVRGVRPDGTRMRITVEEEMRVGLSWRQAVLEGLRPIAFRGRARSRDVEAYLRRDVSAGGGVLHVLAATPVVVERAAGEELAVRLDLGPVHARTTLPCDAISLARGEPAAAAAGDDGDGDGHDDGDGDDDDGEHVLPRGRRLRLYADGSARRPALELRRSPDGEWPPLEVRGHERGRLRVRARLDDGATLDAWIDARDAVAPSEEGDAGSTCDCPPAPHCGGGFAGAVSYHGPAIVTAGSPLLDGASGRPWGRVIEDTPASIAIVDGGAAVHVQRIAGITWDPCDPASIRVATGAVRRRSP